MQGHVRGAGSGQTRAPGATDDAASSPALRASNQVLRGLRATDVVAQEMGAGLGSGAPLLGCLPQGHPARRSARVDPGVRRNHDRAVRWQGGVRCFGSRLATAPQYRPAKGSGPPKEDLNRPLPVVLAHTESGACPEQVLAESGVASVVRPQSIAAGRRKPRVNRSCRVDRSIPAAGEVWSRRRLPSRRGPSCGRPPVR